MGKKVKSNKGGETIPIRIGRVSSHRRPAKKIPVRFSEERPKGSYIYVATPNLDQRESERARRRRRTVKNLILSAAALFSLLIILGIGYIKYIDQKIPVTTLNVSANIQGAQAKPITPVIPAADAPVGVSIASFSTPIKRGEEASLYAQTNPGALCSIKVSYGSVQDIQPALKAAKADDLGGVSWNWYPPSAVPDGDWPVIVTCVNGSKSGVMQQTLSIID